MKASLMPSILAMLCASALPARAQAERQRLTASDHGAFDYFGSAVSMSGDWAVIGALRYDGVADDEGTAYFFRREGRVWVERDRVSPSDVAAGDGAGEAVSLSGDFAILGVRFHDHVASSSGSAYIFERGGISWTEVAEFTGGAYLDLFGTSVAIDGDTRTAVVGAPGVGPWAGRAYVYEQQAGIWSLQAVLLGSDTQPDDGFGSSVAIDGDRILVGANFDDSAGSGYVFQRVGGTWVEEARLVPAEQTQGALIGSAAALQGSVAVLGAYKDEGLLGNENGAAYVFELDQGNWQQTARLLASDGDVLDWFGRSLDVHGDKIVVGAPEADLWSSNDDSGAAYVFEKHGGAWIEVAKLHGGPDGEQDSFGSAVSVSDELILSSATLGDDAEYQAGSVYAFELGLGQSFCVSSPNSTGFAARISGRGSPFSAAPAIRLFAAPVPDQFGLFYFGTGSLQQPFGNGHRCVGGVIARFPVQQATGNQLTYIVDTENRTDFILLPGSTRYFQAWFRDPAGGGAGFDLSDGLSVVFE